MGKVIFTTSGQISGKGDGWRFESSAASGGIAFNPFEGYYPDKGGKLIAPKIPVVGGQYYRLRFSAKTPERSFEAVNFYDASGKWLADNYDVLFAGDRQEYDRVVFATPGTAVIEVFFQTTCGVEAWDVEISEASWEDAAEYCDCVYAQLPPLEFHPAGNPLVLAPRTQKALREGRPWRVLMLGDSIMQDTYHSQFHALLKRHFPNLAMEWLVSVRGGTGCWYYAEPEHFAEYVTPYRPDCVFIGGISHWNHPQSPWNGVTGIEETGHRIAEELGAEVVVMTPTLAQDFRLPEGTPSGTPCAPMEFSLERAECCRNGHNLLEYNKLDNICSNHGWPLWDMTMPAYKWLFASGRPFEFYSRDATHSGGLGKQIIARIAEAFFLASNLNL